MRPKFLLALVAAGVIVVDKHDLVHAEVRGYEAPPITARQMRPDSGSGVSGNFTGTTLLLGHPL